MKLHSPDINELPFPIHVLDSTHHFSIRNTVLGYHKNSHAQDATFSLKTLNIYSTVALHSSHKGIHASYFLQTVVPASEVASFLSTSGAPRSDLEQEGKGICLITYLYCMEREFYTHGNPISWTFFIIMQIFKHLYAVCVWI